MQNQRSYEVVDFSSAHLQCVQCSKNSN